MRTSSTLVSLAALLAAAWSLTTAPALAQVRVYCCDDAKGRKGCGDFLPPGCVGR